MTNITIIICYAADHEKMDAAKAELLQLLEKPQLAGISVCVCVGGGRQLMTTAPVKRYQLE